MDGSIAKDHIDLVFKADQFKSSRIKPAALAKVAKTTLLVGIVQVLNPMHGWCLQL